MAFPFTGAVFHGKTLEPPQGTSLNDWEIVISPNLTGWQTSGPCDIDNRRLLGFNISANSNEQEGCWEIFSQYSCLSLDKESIETFDGNVNFILIPKKIFSPFDQYKGFLDSASIRQNLSTQIDKTDYYKYELNLPQLIEPSVLPKGAKRPLTADDYLLIVTPHEFSVVDDLRLLSINAVSKIDEKEIYSLVNYPIIENKKWYHISGVNYSIEKAHKSQPGLAVIAPFIRVAYLFIPKYIYDFLGNVPLSKVYVNRMPLSSSSVIYPPEYVSESWPAFLTLASVGFPGKGKGLCGFSFQYTEVNNPNHWRLEVSHSYDSKKNEVVFKPQGNLILLPPTIYGRAEIQNITWITQVLNSLLKIFNLLMKLLWPLNPLKKRAEAPEELDHSQNLD